MLFESTISVQLNDDLKHVVMLCDFFPHLSECHIKVLRKHKEVFTWEYVDMPNIDHEIVSHNIFTYPDATPV